MTNLFKTIERRNEGAKNIVKFNKVSPEDKKQLSKALSFQFSVNICSKVAMVMLAFIPLRMKLLDKTSKYFWKEISLLAGLLSFDFAVKYANNEYFWAKNRDVVRKYALMKEAEYFNLKKLGLENIDEKNDRLYE